MNFLKEIIALEKSGKTTRYRLEKIPSEDLQTRPKRRASRPRAVKEGLKELKEAFSNRDPKRFGKAFRDLRLYVKGKGFDGFEQEDFLPKKQQELSLVENGKNNKGSPRVRLSKYSEELLARMEQKLDSLFKS